MIIRDEIRCELLEGFLAKGFRRVVRNELLFRGCWLMTGTVPGMARAAMGGGVTGGLRMALIARIVGMGHGRAGGLWMRDGRPAHLRTGTQEACQIIVQAHGI